jgi:hypothetical protein
VGRYLVPATVLASTIALAVAAFTAGLTPYRPAWWSASVRLAVLGGIVPIIYAVNIRIVPVFSRRDWASLSWLRAQNVLAVAGGWTVFTAGIRRSDDLAATGHALALAGGALFMANLVRLFRQSPVARPAPPLPYPEHKAVDRIATDFTRLSGVYLLAGLVVGLIMTVDLPRTGRWDLVWAHAMLVGFFLSMASGVCYHTLSRWTGKRWKWIATIRIHYLTTLIALPLMLLALATNRQGLFSIAGPIQATALLLFLANIVPLVWAMTGVTRPAVLLAISCLLAGVTLGAWFAGHPVMGVKFRFIHAGLNLFGWSGLLISGVAYYLVPRFFSRPLRWPRLAAIQIGLLTTGIIGSALAWTWRIEGDGPSNAIAIAHGLTAAGFVLLGVIVAGTLAFGGSRAATVSALPMQKSFTRPPTGIGLSSR